MKKEQEQIIKIFRELLRTDKEQAKIFYRKYLSIYRDCYKGIRTI